MHINRCSACESDAKVIPVDHDGTCRACGKQRVPPFVNDVTHPPHYVNGRTHEPIDVILDWNLDFCLGNVVKYIARYGRKMDKDPVKDLLKARFYLERAIQEKKKAP